VDLGTDVFTGSVPTGGTHVDRAEASFGQGKTLVSPIVMAATAAVASGHRHQPKLVLDLARPSPRPMDLR
jgi:cell division protein FtsI/penicillin-binding protein 2